MSRKLPGEPNKRERLWENEDQDQDRVDPTEAPTEADLDLKEEIVGDEIITIVIEITVEIIEITVEIRGIIIIIETTTITFVEVPRHPIVEEEEEEDVVTGEGHHLRLLTIMVEEVLLRTTVDHDP